MASAGIQPSIAAGIARTEGPPVNPWPKIQRLVVLGELSSPLHVLRQDHPDATALLNAAFQSMRQLRDFIDQPLRLEHIGNSSSTQNGRSIFNWYGQGIRNRFLRLREQAESEMRVHVDSRSITVLPQIIMESPPTAQPIRIDTTTESHRPDIRRLVDLSEQFSLVDTLCQDYPHERDLLETARAASRRMRDTINLAASSGFFGIGNLNEVVENMHGVIEIQSYMARMERCRRRFARRGDADGTRMGVGEEDREGTVHWSLCFARGVLGWICLSACSVLSRLTKGRQGKLLGRRDDLEERKLHTTTE